jgi:hypothetical protein
MIGITCFYKVCIQYLPLQDKKCLDVSLKKKTLFSTHSLQEKSFFSSLSRIKIYPIRLGGNLFFKTSELAESAGFLVLESHV